MFMEIPPHLMRLELLSLDQAALIAAGLDPMQVGNCEHAASGCWTGWEAAKANKIALKQAVALKNIRPVSATIWVAYNSFGDGEEEQVDVDSITLKDLNHLHDATFLRDDALSFFGWPVESPVTGIAEATIAIDAANLTQRLAEAELKAERLAQELAVIAAERDKLRHELQGLTENLVSAKKDAAQSQANLQKAKTDLLQGKSRTSALKLVGGMAMAVYKIPIKSSRLTGLAELKSDLERVGVTISEDVIRNHLNAAAEVI